MRNRFFVLSGLLVLAACVPVTPGPATTNSGTVVSSSEEADFTNEGMPETTDSLETPTVTGASLTVQTVASGAILVGDTSAPPLRMFTDYGCEYCREFALTLRPWIEQEYAVHGELSLEIVFVPMTPAGTYMAKIAICSEKQKMFVKADHQLALSPVSTDKQLITFAKDVGLNLAQLRSCMASAATTKTLSWMKAQADAAGVTRLPSFELSEEAWIGVPEQSDLAKILDEAIHR